MATPHILIVEDHEVTGELMRRHLDAIASVTVEGGVAPAIERVDMVEPPFDLCIIDIHLGGEEDGVVLLNKLRTRPDYEDVPMLACTAHALPGDKEKYLAAGFDAYLAKPFVRKDFQTKVQDLMSSQLADPTDSA